MEAKRADAVNSAVRLEVLSIAWMVVEMAVSIGAGIAARSLLLTAFGIDSLIELVSGGILLWRLRLEGSGGSLERVRRAEKRAGWVVALTLGLLCLYVLVSSIYGLLFHSAPDISPLGIGVSAAAVLIMPYLAIRKRAIARRIDSEALAGDAVNSWTCAYMAGTVLLGLLLNVVYGWWWVEYAAALLFLAWLFRETLEAFAEVREAGSN